jgi:hypothetical protein
MEGKATSRNSLAQAALVVNVDLRACLRNRNVGTTPLVPRQWPWVVFDSGVVHWAATLCARIKRLDELRRSDSKRFGKQAPKVLEDISAAREEMNTAVEELGWFKTPPESPLAAALDNAIASLNLLLKTLEELTRDTRCDLSAQIEASEKATAALDEAIAEPMDFDRTPISMVYDLFQIPADCQFATSALEPNTLRALSPLDDREMDHLSEELLMHLMLPQSKWPPSPTVHLASMLVAERPLVAHRMAAFTSSLVTKVFEQRPKQALRALREQRNRGQSQFASAKEIATEIGFIREAEAQGDEEAVALATARLYSAAVEGPVRGVAVTLLQLTGVKLPDKPSLVLLRDQLRGKTGSRVDFAHAFEPEWRNAVDHREFHWDPVRQVLNLRGEKVPQEDLSQRYDFGISGMVGVECGITLAVAANPELLDEVDRASPLHEDRVLVEHRVAQGLAGHGIATRVITTPDGLTVGPIADNQVIGAIGGLVGSIDATKAIDRYEIQFETSPPLIVSRDVLRLADRLRRRDGQNNRILDTEAVNPIFVAGLIELGVDPQEAITRGAKAAATGVAVEAGSTAVSKASRARRTAKKAKVAIRTIRESARIARTTSTSARELEQSLRRVESSATSYLRSGARDPDHLLAQLRHLFDLLEALPPPAFPWFESSKSENLAA